jgi:hypothetical protein
MTQPVVIETRLVKAEYHRTHPWLVLTFAFSPYFLWSKMTYDEAVTHQPTLRAWIERRTLLIVRYDPVTYRLLSVKENPIAQLEDTRYSPECVIL